MKRFLSTVCLCLMLFSQTELYQLLKLPVFVAHYFEHKQEDPSISLKSFFVLHYLSGNEIDEDYQRDMQLPFKTQVFSFVGSISVEPTNQLFAIEIPVTFIGIQQHVFFQQSFPSFYSTDIWQPPRLV